MASLILFSVVYLTTRPAESQAKARDGKRLSDMQVLARVVDEFRIDTGDYPDFMDALRKSTVLPESNAGPLESPVRGWIKQDLSRYNVKLPLDPQNDENYYYSYKKTTTGYELNAVLEYYLQYAQDDGGSSPAIYELGTDLGII